MTAPKTPHRAPQSLQYGLASAAAPPFHEVPVRRGLFNYLALLSRERERAVGVENGEAVRRLDGEIREIITDKETVGSMLKYLFSSQERTYLKIDKLLRQLSELVEEQAILEGTIRWFSNSGKAPYSPVYPSGFVHGDLTNLREELLFNELLE
jgi:hypothetical protein